MPFFESVPGHYFIQVIVYTLVIVAGTELLVAMWHIKEPIAHIKLRFLGLVLPLLCPLLFDVIYPSRNGLYFREQVAVIDINTWLKMGGSIAVWYFIALIIVVSIIIFIIVEGLPFLRSRMPDGISIPVIKEGQFPRLDAAITSYPADTDGVPSSIMLSPGDVPTIYRHGKDRLVISESMIDLLDDDELQAIIGHEIAHRSKRIGRINRFLLILRWLHFYNPLVFLIFRRIIKDIEKLCDDAAIRLSGKRLSLISGLIKVYQLAKSDTSQSKEVEQAVRRYKDRLEDTASLNMVRERVKRLVADDSTAEENGFQDSRMVVTALILIALLFFIV